jgi:hypothetical protein
MAKKSIINIWDKFNNLTIIELLPSKRYGKKMYRMMRCKCDCGNETILQLSALKIWHTKSCWKCDFQKNTTHWLMRKWITNWLWFVWNWIQRRINNKNSKEYKNYWWRWIKCEWNNIYDFLQDMQWTYKKWLTLERIDVNWNYCKDNCKWITNKEQQRNRTNTIRIKYNWENKSLPEWCEILWLKYRTIARRLEWWWDWVDALTIPVTSKWFRYKTLTTK